MAVTLGKVKVILKKQSAYEVTSMRKLLTLSIAASFACAAQADTLIYAGTLIDGTQSKPLKEKTLVVENGRITAIKDGFPTPQADDVVIDRRNGTVMPGFIDMHTHLTSQLGPGSYMHDFTHSAADVAIDAVNYANKTLMAGFTTV